MERRKRRKRRRKRAVRGLRVCVFVCVFVCVWVGQDHGGVHTCEKGGGRKGVIEARAPNNNTSSSRAARRQQQEEDRKDGRTKECGVERGDVQRCRPKST